MRNTRPKVVVGVDLGATRTKMALIDPRAPKVRIAQLSRPTLSASSQHRTDHALVERLSAQVRALLDRAPQVKASALGVGFCGIVDADRGVVLQTTDTLKGVRNLGLADALQEALGLPCRIDNDANVATLAEGTLGHGAKANSFAMFTLGTGVGGGMMVQGALLRGAGFMAGNLGHIKVRRQGRKCACGARGCLEAYASAWAWRRAVTRYAPLRGADAKRIFEAARAQDPFALRLVNEAAEALGSAMSSLAVTTNPEVIAVGGGLSRGWSQLHAGVQDSFVAGSLDPAITSTRIVKAQLGPHAGVLGAALLASL